MKLAVAAVFAITDRARACVNNRDIYCVATRDGRYDSVEIPSELTFEV